MTSCSQLWEEFCVRKNVDEDFRAMQRIFNTEKAFTNLTKKYSKEPNVELKTTQLARLNIIHTLRHCYLETPKTCQHCSVCKDYDIFYLHAVQLFQTARDIALAYELLQKKNDMLQKTNTQLQTLLNSNAVVNVVQKPLLKCSNPACTNLRKNSKKTTRTCGLTECANYRKAINSKKWRLKVKVQKNEQSKKQKIV